MRNLLVCFSVALSVVACNKKPPAAELPEVRVAVGGKASMYVLALTVAGKLGYFEAEGVHVDISDFGGGTEALRSVVGGSADVVVGGYDQTINIQAKKQLFTAFVQLARIPAWVIGISAEKAKTYKSPADLKGYRVAVSAPGAGTQTAFALLLAKGGLTAADVSFIGVGMGAIAVTSVKSGQVDAISNFDPTMTMLEEEGAIKIIADTRTDAGVLDLAGTQIPGVCVYAPAAYVQAHPDIVQSLTNAIVRADAWIQNASDEQLKATIPAEYMQGNAALYWRAFAKVRPALSADGMISPEGAAGTLRALATIMPEIKPDAINLEATFTNDFVKKAHAHAQR